jgi:hypothetical protein
VIRYWLWDGVEEEGQKKGETSLRVETPIIGFSGVREVSRAMTNLDQLETVLRRAVAITFVVIIIQSLFAREWSRATAYAAAALATIGLSISLSVLANRLILSAHSKESDSKQGVSPGEKIRKALIRLEEGSSEIDTIILEIRTQLQERQEALEQLTEQHRALSEEEEALTKRIASLKEVRFEVAEYFDEMTKRHIRTAEQEHRKRDYRLFAAGAVIASLIAPIIALFTEPYFHRLFHR